MGSVTFPVGETKEVLNAVVPLFGIND